MQRAALLTALAVLVPLAAHADPTAAPAPPGPPPPSSPGYRPPPLTRATTVDDLAGDWKVTATIRFTSCNLLTPGPGARVEESWAIDHQAGTITIRTDAAQEYTGSAVGLKYGSFRHQLSGKPRPTEEVLQLNHHLKDRFYGTILRAQALPRKGGLREVCVTQIDISGKRSTP